MKRVVLPVLIALALGCDAPREQPVDEPAAALVAVVTVATQSLPRSIEVGGVIQARTTAMVSSRIVAEVRAVRVKAGDRVRAGDPIVLLDSRDLDVNVRRTAAGIGAEEHAVRAAEGDLAATQAALTLARAAHERIAQLHARRSATAQELDEALAALRGAEAREAAARSRIAVATSVLSVSREAAAAATVAASFAAVTAPFDGIVTETLVDPGDLASPGAPLVRIDDTRSFRLELQIDESQAALIADSQPVEVTLESAAAAAGEGPSLTGRVIEISRRVDAGAHAFVVKVDLSGAPGVRAGAFARARFAAPPREALAIPASAIVSQGQLPTVFVVSAGHARMRVVRLGNTGDNVEVVAGLAAGEQVITNPSPSLRDGDAVQAAPAGGR